MAFEGFPLIVGWELTLACNIYCRHCSSSAGLPRVKELTLKEAFSICDQFPALAVKEVILTGGEPLVRPDWWRIAERISQKNIRPRVVTNGLLLNTDNTARLGAAGVKTVVVSIDGLEDTHDKLRDLPGMWRRIIANISRAVKSGVNVGVITAVNSKNIAELPALLTVLRSIGVDHWQVQPFLSMGRGIETPHLHLSQIDYLALGIFCRRERAQQRETGFRILPADSLGYFSELDDTALPWHGCAAGLYKVGITSHGKVKGCLSLPDEFIEGDLRRRKLWNIWFDKKAFPYTRRFTPEQIGPSCDGCEKAAECRGGCNVMSLSSTGRFHNNPFCFTGLIKNASPAL